MIISFDSDGLDCCKWMITSPPHPHPLHTTPPPHPPCCCFSRLKKSGLVTTAAGGILDGSWQACLSAFRHASSSTYFTTTTGFARMDFLNAPFFRITVSRIFCLHRPSSGKENIYLHLSEGKQFLLISLSLPKVKHIFTAPAYWRKEYLYKNAANQSNKNLIQQWLLAF